MHPEDRYGSRCVYLDEKEKSKWDDWFIEMDDEDQEGRRNDKFVEDDDDFKTFLLSFAFSFQSSGFDSCWRMRKWLGQRLYASFLFFSFHKNESAKKEKVVQKWVKQKSDCFFFWCSSAPPFVYDNLLYIYLVISSWL